MSRENLVVLLARIGERTGVDFSLDDDNFCSLVLDDRLELSIEYKPGTDCLILTADCGPLPVENRQAALQEMLDANFAWAETGGATLSTNSLSGIVYLQYREHTAVLDEQRLQNLLQAIVNNAELWQERLKRTAQGAPGSTDSAELTAHQEFMGMGQHGIIAV